jgi:hypothetical protein
MDEAARRKALSQLREAWMDMSGQSRSADNDVLCVVEPGFERKSTST